MQQKWLKCTETVSLLCNSLAGMCHWSGCLAICIKVEYHANENPLKYSEKDNICWSKVNVSNNQKNIKCYHASFFLVL